MNGNHCSFWNITVSIIFFTSPLWLGTGIGIAYGVEWGLMAALIMFVLCNLWLIHNRETLVWRWKNNMRLWRISK